MQICVACIMVSQSRTATSSAAQHAKPEITSANSTALFSHVFFSQLLIGPSVSRDVLCEVRTNVISTPTGESSVPSAFATRGRVLFVCDCDSTAIVDRNGMLQETAILEEKARCNN